MPQPSLSNLSGFIQSVLNPKQIDELIALLNQGSSTALDPDATPRKDIPVKPIAPAGIDELLNEMESAYSIEKFKPLTPDESRRVRDSFPGFIERCSAYQGRHLVMMLREKLRGEAPSKD